jgi:hypothetical protein
MGICGNKDRRNKDAYGAPYRESDSGRDKSGSDNSSYSVNSEESKRQTPKITSQKPSQKPSLKAMAEEKILPARSLAPSPGSKPPSKQKLSKVSEKPEKKPKFTERLPSIPDKKISLST